MPRTGPNHARLLADEDLRRWHANLARRSKTRADIFLRQLDNFCLRTKTEPKQLPYLGEKRARDLLLDFVESEQRAGRAGGYTLSMVKSVQAWLAHCGCKWELKVNIDGAYDSPTLDEVPPIDQDGLRRIFNAATPRERAASALISHSGLRLESLGDYLGEDGLTIADLPELRLKGKSVSFGKIPTMVSVRPGVSKTRRPYFTFLGSEGCQYVAEYLEGRSRRGERLKPNSPVIVPERAGLKFIRTTNIGDLIRSAIRKAGYPNRPYDLRVFFATQLQIGGAKAQLPDKWRLFWMGHVVDRNDRPYTVGRARLNPAQVSEMREAYHRAEPFLSTVRVSRQPDEAELKRAVLGVFLPAEEVAKIDVTKISPDDLRRLVTERVRGSDGESAASVQAPPTTYPPGNSPKGPTVPEDVAPDVVAGSVPGPHPRNGQAAKRAEEEVVPVNEVRERLAHGWTWVASLGPQDAILRRPG